ncbi:hypothetical protein CONCODRAFT_167593 [Conidiobolus coronatus NRRL 28638]|uniref:ATP-dependent RNA helicase n=1 Tax=Conidiobolus coronatus (strain ATCC 28846 / CBS 209.66 / NRRL 28638) TaxID=796925 RepID=A0A137PE30_CONC2|nr:hypothetical protein CONCODRAFT_167593 [Conidiobolus coronatus NRRL 28638]|eukprot:KXN73240.1 hypothetical protein CONCODRAFT_167593 [Conidiobolus coronatus NRRL 28638]
MERFIHVDDFVEDGEELEEIKDKLGDWIHYELHDNIMKSLYKPRFFTPTQIQKDTLLNHGSEKTLTFGLPILQRIVEVDLTDAECKKVYGLILAPTRELALQITQDLKQIGKYIPIFIEGLL